jgi:aminoglycoside/choline kinase family phosphotransferase
VTYYTRDYVDVEGAPLIHCYSAAFSAEQERYHLLLDDLSETHVEAAQKAPTVEYGLALAEGLAVMHACWWGAQQLAEAGAPIHDAAHIRRFVDIAEPGAGHILGRFSAELEPHWPELMRELFAGHLQAIVERTQDDNGFTLIHGDVGHNNILVPRDGERPIYIIDRQPFDWSLTTWLGVYDLAYAMVLDWEVETRRRLEVPVLKRYHDWLVRSGVVGYSWDQLYEDYRLCVPMCVYIATEYCRGGINERWLPVWLPYLQRSLTACDDLDCSALW